MSAVLRSTYLKGRDPGGTATDTGDDTLSGSALVWSTNRGDLQATNLGTGPKLTVRLYSDNCLGNWHEATLTVTDSDGNTRTALRRIFIWNLC